MPGEPTCYRLLLAAFFLLAFCYWQASLLASFVTGWDKRIGGLVNKNYPGLKILALRTRLGSVSPSSRLQGLREDFISQCSWTSFYSGIKLLVHLGACTLAQYFKL
uniref:Uncharacterized protein n=2 Tax=Picea TaxID=3328 RepID=A0A101M582_PICGL|nr:hypothetical protein ABT39_MTgene1181 [Picea glauca]QHR91745.1 hypothetical protein Q903MT_gene5781 [Picea sitchensis]